MKLFAFSGLGADERVFEYLNLEVPIIPVKWIPPQKDESLSDYSKRLSLKIDGREPFGLIGVSFGGMVAGTISKILHPELTIIISSATKSSELPQWWQLVRKTGILKMISSRVIKPSPFLIRWLFSTKNKQLLDDIIRDTDADFLKWALNCILRWNNSEEPVNCFRIHGDADRLIPLKGKVDFSIQKGGHFMVVDQGKEISAIINNRLKSIQR